MKLGKKTIILGTLILLCSLSFSMLVQGKHTYIEIDYEYFWDYTEPPVKEWFDKNGLYHGILTPHYTTSVTGDITGEGYYIGNVVLDLESYCGWGHGRFEINGLYEGEEAGLKGISNFYVEYGILYGELVCTGSGALQGLLFRGTLFAYLGWINIVHLEVWNA